jgi:hypothetical protein
MSVGCGRSAAFITLQRKWNVKKTKLVMRKNFNMNLKHLATNNNKCEALYHYRLMMLLFDI